MNKLCRSCKKSKTILFLNSTEVIKLVISVSYEIPFIVRGNILEFFA